MAQAIKLVTQKAKEAKGLSEGDQAKYASQHMKSRQHKNPKQGSGKEKANDVPSKYRRERSFTDENGKDFADRLVEKNAGKGLARIGI